MEGWNARAVAARGRAAVMGVCLMSHAAAAGEEGSNVRLRDTSHRFAVLRALGGAARQLQHAECQGLLDEFRDAAGQPLRTGLERLGHDAPEYLRGGIFFYDAPERNCGSANVTVTQPGNRAILVCGRRFLREMMRNSRHAEALLIHEMLHSLGLGENPPTSHQITARVRARCDGRGPLVGGEAVARTRP